MTQSAVVVQDLVYEYPLKRALHGVSCDIPEGSVTALVGPNGAGKTTLMRCIAALENPYSGSVRIFGVDTAAHPRKVHQLIGYLSDFFGLYENLTVRQSLLHIGMMQGLSGAYLEQRALEVAKTLGLDGRLEEFVANLSRGLKQRVGIAQTILHNPKLLILDEPAAGLDPDARRDLSTLIRTLASSGMTILVSSHILTELEDYSTSMLTVNDGRIAGHSLLTTSGATATSHVVIAVITEAHERALEVLKADPAVASASVRKEGVEIVIRGSSPDEEERVLALLVNQGIRVREFYRVRESLEDLYRAHVKR